MMFNLDTGGASLSIKAYTNLTDGIRDQLGSHASMSEQHYAIAGAMIKKIDGYKSVKFLVRFWFSQAGPLAEIGDHDPILLMDLVNHFSAKLDELT